MDPNATHTIMCDTSPDMLSERRTAAVDMLVWLARGGHAPDNAMRAAVIGQAETIILDAIDDAEGALHTFDPATGLDYTGVTDPTPI